MTPKKMLPFNPHPIIDAYSLYAGRFAILSNFPEFKPLLIINHLMLCYYLKDCWLDFNFGGYRSIGYRETEIINELKESDLTGYLTDKIDHNYYILLALDHFFIRNTASYRNEHFMHDIAVVYGYDQQAEEFYLADNFDEMNRFIPLQAPFDQIVEARRYVENNPPCPERILAYSLSLNPEDCYKFDSAEILHVVNDYLNSRYTLSMRHTQDFTRGEKVFGVGIYHILRKMLENREFHKIDFRAFHVLMNHKAILLMLIDLLEEHQLMHDRETHRQNFQQIFRSSIILRNLVLKLLVSGEMKLIDRAISLLDKISDEEVAAINYLLKSIDQEGC